MLAYLGMQTYTYMYTHIYTYMYYGIILCACLSSCSNIHSGPRRAAAAVISWRIAVLSLWWPTAGSHAGRQLKRARRTRGRLWQRGARVMGEIERPSAAERECARRSVSLPRHRVRCRAPRCWPTSIFGQGISGRNPLGACKDALGDRLAACSRAAM